MTLKRKRRDIGIYKPNNKKNGSVAQFKISHNDDCMFLEAANQVRDKNDPKPYDWDSKIVVKLGIPDISKLLLYLELNKPSAPLKLFHQSPGGGSKSVELKYQEYNGKPSYYLSVGSQKASGGQPTRVSTPIGLDEAEIMKIGFRKAVEIILGWDTPSSD